MKRLLLSLFIVWSHLLLAQDNNGIPTKYMNDPAVDLTRNGQLLLPDEVHDLFTNSSGRFDISTLNPVETSDLWKNVYPKVLPKQVLPINDDDEVLYHSPILTESGTMRMNIINKNGENKFYTMMLSKSVHTSLLIKSLLQKIGYTIPEIKRLSRVTVKFKDETQKKVFINYLEDVARAGASSSWIVEDYPDKLVLQDVVVTTSNNSIYNLAYGIRPGDAQGRRLLSALVVPLSIVNLSESINMLRWNAGMIRNKEVILDVPNQPFYQCTWDDARWIARRIEKLTREDWKDIIASSEVPKVVQQVMLEKVISRRNNVMRLFKVDAEQMKVEDKLNSGVELVDGKITQQTWPGFASRFAYGDPESPLSDTDMGKWLGSRAQSMGMEIAMQQLNKVQDWNFALTKHNKLTKEMIAEATAKSIADKKPNELSVKGWVLPTYRGKIIVSRNVVTGTYLGTDKLVQIVDTVGFSLDVGLIGGAQGAQLKRRFGKNLLPVRVPDVLPVGVSAGGQISYLRTYAHLRPIYNIKKDLKLGFKNIYVPMVKKEIGDLLHKAYSTSINPEATEDQRADAVQAALKPFKDMMVEGESILVTNTVVIGAGGKAGVNLYGKLLSASLGLSANHVVLSRFHVHRRSEDTFQVYRDIGQKASFSANLNIDSLVPIFTITMKKAAGTAKVKYYNINLAKKNPKVFENAQALRGALIDSNTDVLDEKEIKPYVLKHKFKESTPSGNLLFYHLIKQNSATDITVVNPLGEERYFRRYYHGNTRGRNYQAYVTAVVNHWVGMLFDQEAGLSEGTGTNPGYSFKGQAKTKVVTMDQELDKKGNVIEPFVTVSRIWNGWSISKKKAEALLEEIRHHYKFQFFEAPILNDTSKIKLYNIGANLMFYQRGLEHLEELFKKDENQIRRLFLEYEIQDNLVINPDIDEAQKDEDWKDPKYKTSKKFLKLYKKYVELRDKGHDDRANKKLLRALSHLEKKVYLPGIAILMGGEENIYAYARIEGFREGDETADQGGLMSNSFGQYGSPRVLGPVMQMQKTTDMLEGEFFINWMMQRLI